MEMSLGLRRSQRMGKKHKEKEVSKAAQEVAPAEEFSSELSEPSWSVVTRDSVAVSHLKYDEAALCAEGLKKQGISGICIVTDEAAARVTG